MKRLLSLIITIFSFNFCYCQTAEDYYIRGNEKYELKLFAESIFEYSKAIEINPQYWKVYFARGESKRQLKDFRGALADFNKTIEIHPSFESYFARGVVKCSGLNDCSGSLEDFNMSIKLNPSYDAAYYGRGLALINLGKKELGCLDLSKAGELGMVKVYELIQKKCN